MDFLIDVFLPLSLAFIMFSLGLGLKFSDFARVVRQPVGFFVGAIGQLVLLPLVALGLIWIFGLAGAGGDQVPVGALAVGFMILALSPGGVTSNLMTGLARGDVALSVSLTALISLAVVLTLPLILGPMMQGFMGAQAPEFSLVATAVSMFLIVAVPVGLGLGVRHLFAARAMAAQPYVSGLATGLFCLIVIGALLSSWDLFIAHLGQLGPALISLNLIMLALGFTLAHFLGLGPRVATTIAIETGVQNATIGVTVGGLVAGQAMGDATFSAFAIASGVYGITMYVCTLPFVLWRRLHAPA